MASMKPGILILTPFFSPNIGGVETHLSDLVTLLIGKPCKVFVHTYTPLTTPNTIFSFHEHHNNIDIYRYRWLSGNYFNQLERFPLLQFLYLVPYLFLRSFCWMIANSSQITVIHSHGIAAAIIGNIISFVFRKQHITSIHAVYDYLNSSSPVTRHILSHTDGIFTLSESSKNQLVKWGINPKRISLYKYWLDLDKFSPSDKVISPFTLLFVGRLIPKKGISLFLRAAKSFPRIIFMVIGTGPSAGFVQKYSRHYKNIDFVGQISNENLPQYINQSSALCIPSLYQEGFGRVIMEALACGKPIIGSNLGGIPEAVDNSVSILFKPTLTNLKKAIRQISDISAYNQLQSKCRAYAETNFSSANADIFLKSYGL